MNALEYKNKLFLGFFLFFLSISFVSQAAQYDLKEITPEVQQAISSRQSHYNKLQDLKAAKIIGENNKGYVEVRQSSGDADSLASAENQNRKTIYRAIADQNGLGSEGLNVIESVFAEVQRDKARSGDLIQLPSGEWTSKS